MSTYAPLSVMWLTAALYSSKYYERGVNRLNYGIKTRRTVSLNVLPRPVARGHMRSIRKVTRKRLICSWSMKISTVVWKSRNSEAVSKVY